MSEAPKPRPSRDFTVCPQWLQDQTEERRRTRALDELARARLAKKS